MKVPYCPLTLGFPTVCKLEADILMVDYLGIVHKLKVERPVAFLTITEEMSYSDEEILDIFKADITRGLDLTRGRQLIVRDVKLY